MIYRNAPIQQDTLTAPTGASQVVTQSTVTVDDILYLSVRNYAAEVKSGRARTYETPSADIIQQITRVPHG